MLIAARRWDDLLDLALTEIRDYGATSTQVTRRVRALLESLDRRVRPEHRAAVAEQLAALDEALWPGARVTRSRARSRPAGPPGHRRAVRGRAGRHCVCVARARARSAAMCVAAEVSGAASTSPIIPNRLPPAIVTISTAERVDAERRAERDRLDHLLQDAVGQQHDDGHDQRGRRALRPEREQHRERARRPRAQVRDVRGGEVDERDRAGVVDVEHDGRRDR